MEGVDGRNIFEKKTEVWLVDTMLVLVTCSPAAQNRVAEEEWVCPLVPGGDLVR